MLSNFAFADRIAAEHLAVMREFTHAVPVRVGELAKALGLKVVEATLPLSISGMIRPDESGAFVIRVNRFEPKERQRFTIAHEIAHFLLHRSLITRGVVDSTLYRSKLSSRLEAEANRLAADIIMPRQLVSQQLAEIPPGIEDPDAYLAEKFRVSRAAMDIRTS